MIEPLVQRYVPEADYDALAAEVAEWKSKARGYDDLFTQENARACAAEARLAEAERVLLASREELMAQYDAEDALSMVRKIDAFLSTTDQPDGAA